MMLKLKQSMCVAQATKVKLPTDSNDVKRKVESGACAFEEYENVHIN